MVKSRSPAAAGRFYPSDREALGVAVDGLLAEASPAMVEVAPIGLIVPHAGYVYSGPIAATAYATIAPSPPSRVVLLGPSHFVPLTGCAVSSAEAWTTPLGDVPIDEELRAAATSWGAATDDAAHEVEHALEVQLPFLQRLGVERALPVAAGATEPGEVADLIAALRAAAEDALVVTSTDLSHYLDAETAAKRDRRTADAVARREPEGIGRDDACGLFALRGIVEWCRRAGLDVRLLDLRSSADTSGDPTSVVGYAAFAILSSAKTDGRPGGE